MAAQKLSDYGAVLSSVAHVGVIKRVLDHRLNARDSPKLLTPIIVHWRPLDNFILLGFTDFKRSS